MPDSNQTIVVTYTGEPQQPVRLYWKVKNRAAVLAVFRALECVDEDADWSGRWVWLYSDEASGIELTKRPDEVPVERRPIALSQIAFPAKDKMVMRFFSPERAIAAAKFFGPVVSGNSWPRLMRPRGSNSSACHQGVSDEQPYLWRCCDSWEPAAS